MACLIIVKKVKSATRRFVTRGKTRTVAIALRLRRPQGGVDGFAVSVAQSATSFGLQNEDAVPVVEDMIFVALVGFHIK